MKDAYDPEQRIEELKQQLAELRYGALSMLVGMADGMAETPEGRAELAQGFDEVAQVQGGEIGRLAQMAAALLREKSAAGMVRKVE